MTITEIKSWAKGWGYSIIKEKDGSLNGASYYWAKNDDPNATGVSLSVSKVARDIYNHMTDNQWVDHQKQYQKDPEFKNETF
jgi:hypothetical protein